MIQHKKTWRTAQAANETIVFTGGGTAGHIFPGLAVIEALREQGFSGRIVWIGSTKDSDRAVVEAAGIEYRAIPSGKLRRNISLQNVADFFRVIAGFFASRKILKEIKPVFLFSKGGYVSVPPCAAAASLGIPFATHESDTSPGLATRLNMRNAAIVFISWPQTCALLPDAIRAKTQLVGNPVRASIREGSAERGRELLRCQANLPVVFFLGGSQGAAQINTLVAESLAALCARVFVVHQAGRGNADQAMRYAQAALDNAELLSRYRVFDFIDKEMPDLLACATIVVGRAGAGTIWESAAAGKPMLLVPLAGASTRGDQVENARLAEEAGAAICLMPEQATAAMLTHSIFRWLDDENAREAAAIASASLGSVSDTACDPGGDMSNGKAAKEASGTRHISAAGRTAHAVLEYIRRTE